MHLLFRFCNYYFDNSSFEKRKSLFDVSDFIANYKVLAWIVLRMNGGGGGGGGGGAYCQTFYWILAPISRPFVCVEDTLYRYRSKELSAQLSSFNSHHKL